MIVFCPSCEASNKPGTKFCNHCGTPMAGEPGSAVPRRAARRGRAAGPGGKYVPKAQLERAYAAIVRLRILFVVFGGLYALFGMAVYLLVPWEDLGQGSLLVFLGIVCGMTGMFFVGSFAVHRHPFVWGVLLSCVMTLDFVVGLLGMFGLLGLWLQVVKLLLVIVAWSATAMVMSVRRLMREYPGLDIVARIKGEAVDDEHRRTRRARQSKRLLADFRVAAVIVVVVGIVAVGVAGAPSFLDDDDVQAATSYRPREFEQPDEALAPAMAKFEALWAKGDLDGIAELYPRRLASRGSRLGRRFESRGLDLDDLPRLGTPSVEPHRDLGQRAGYHTTIGTITVSWLFEDGRWTMVALRLPTR